MTSLPPSKEQAMTETSAGIVPGLYGFYKIDPTPEPSQG